jgi:hypothetical protein
MVRSREVLISLAPPVRCPEYRQRSSTRLRILAFMIRRPFRKGIGALADPLRRTPERAAWRDERRCGWRALGSVARLQLADARSEGVDRLVEEGQQVALAVVLLPAIEGDVDGCDQRRADHPQLQVVARCPALLYE